MNDWSGAPPEEGHSPFEGNPALLPILAQFARQLQGEFEALEDSARSGDSSELCRRAHRLKGAASVLGFARLSCCFAALEELSAAVSPHSSPDEAFRTAIAEQLRICREAAHRIIRTYLGA